MAAETSNDAYVPVSIALTKLAFYFTAEYLENMSVSFDLFISPLEGVPYKHNTQNQIKSKIVAKCNYIYICTFLCFSLVKNGILKCCFDFRPLIFGG